MELDQHVLQLLLNVVVITSATSIALMWYLRRRDKQKLRFYFSLRQKQGPLPPVLARTPQALKTAGGDAESAPATKTSPSGDQDIRQYVARRSGAWVSAAKNN
jgi:hypothetical protein